MLAMCGFEAGSKACWLSCQEETLERTVSMPCLLAVLLFTASSRTRSSEQDLVAKITWT